MSTKAVAQKTGNNVNGLEYNHFVFIYTLKDNILTLIAYTFQSLS
jgi:hypothetical protein